MGHTLHTNRAWTRLLASLPTSRLVLVRLSVPGAGWQVGSPWCFCRARFPTSRQRARRTWSSASRWAWAGARRDCVAGNRAWPRRCGSRCASACWSVATSSGMSAGTAAWTAGEVCWREVGCVLWFVCLFLFVYPLVLGRGGRCAAFSRADRASEKRHQMSKRVFLQLNVITKVWRLEISNRSLKLPKTLTIY